jgi:hypothetical protein
MSGPGRPGPPAQGGKAGPTARRTTRSVRLNLTRSGRVRASGGHGTGVIEEFVDGPLVVGVPSVFERDDPPVGRDQKIRWQPKTTTSGLDRSEHASLRAVVSERGRQAGHRRALSARVKHRARPALHPEPPIQRSFRIGDQQERQLGLVLGQLGGSGVEDDNFPDPVGADLVMPRDRA